MFLYDLLGTEQHPAYQNMAAENLARQYDVLRSIVEASVAVGQPMLSIEVLKALNYHAISCLHTNAGEFRPCAVTVGTYTPPPHHQVAALMQMFTNQVNRGWDAADPVGLAAFVLWRLNHIHPFINGNGRTARAAAYLVLCMKLGGMLPGDPTLPELIRQNRAAYVAALQHADTTAHAGALDLGQLHGLLAVLLNTQMASAQPNPQAPPDAGAEPPPALLGPAEPAAAIPDDQA